MTFLYYVSHYFILQKTIEEMDKNITEKSCTNAIDYSGQICREYLLLSAKMCDTSTSQSVHIFTDASTEADNLITGLQIFGSTECAAAAAPLLCLFLFDGVCDIFGKKQIPTFMECTEIATGVCQREWRLGRSSGFNLPVCDGLPTTQSPFLFCANTITSNKTELSTASM